MGDEQDQDVQRTPLWPPDTEPERDAPLPHSWPAAASPWEGQQPPDALTVSEEPTVRVPAAMPAPAISEEPTIRVPAAMPAPTVSEEPTVRVPAAAVLPPASVPAAPATTPTAPASPPAAAPARKGLSLAWRLGLTLLVCVVLLAGASGLYSYAKSLAAQPQQLMTSYCAALTHDNYRAAYQLLSASAQAQQPEAQYLADAALRDTIQGRVTGCAATPAQSLSALSFLRTPNALIFNAQMTRLQTKQTTTGQIALTRDVKGWHIAALAPSLRGIDLGPITTEQALCQAFSQRAYAQAYALLSTPYQHEQGSATTFARAFGDTLAVTGCAPNLKTYTVNSADQQASLDATLTISVSGTTGGAASSAFPLPAQLRFVREAGGWRVDAITPQLSQ